MFDQPRRELEALRVQCAALQLECAEQKGRVQELETRMEKQKTEFESKLKQFDEFYVNQRTLNLLRSIHTVSTFYVEPPQVVYDGMRTPGGQQLRFGSHQFWKNGVYVRSDQHRNHSIRGTGDWVEIFMFQPPEVLPKSWETRGQVVYDWKLVVVTPFEFIQGRPMKVYLICVEGIEAQLSLFLPPALFFIFKHID